MSKMDEEFLRHVQEHNVEMDRPFQNPTSYEKFMGGFAATIISAAYVFVPFYMIFCIVSLVYSPYSWFVWALFSPIVISAILPPISSNHILQSFPFKYMPAYFDYVEFREVPLKDIESLFSSKNVLLCVQPHGVFSFGGSCGGVTWGKSWWSPEKTPTAVASSVMNFPIVKHIVGIFGMCNAAGPALTKQLQKSSVVLYIGGIAELFLSSSSEEVLFVKKRKGFIKLALKTGAEIMPVYFFGNTSVMEVARYDFLRRFGRLTGMSLTWFWGRWYTPIPKPRKIVGVVGKPLDLPHIPDPTQADIDKYHEVYVSEISRIFHTYKVSNPDYANKELRFE